MSMDTSEVVEGKQWNEIPLVQREFKRSEMQKKVNKNDQ